MSFLKRMFGGSKTSDFLPEERPRETESRSASAADLTANARSSCDSLLRNEKIQSWHRTVTASYDDPICIMIVVPNVAEMGNLLSSFSFCTTNSKGELVMKAGRIAPTVACKLDDGQWVVCLCGGFTKEQFSEVVGPKNKFTCYIVGKDLAKLNRYQISPK